MAKKIELYSCGNGHEYLLWKECPFCCALYQVEPAETDESFKKYIYI